jgi:hypothetical protein
MIEKRHEAVLKPEHARIAVVPGRPGQHAAQIRKAVMPGWDFPHPAGAQDRGPARDR